MGIYTDVQTCFDTALAAVTDIPDVAWENTAFVPTAGTSFVMPTMLPAGGDRATLEERLMNLRGLYQVDVFVEKEKGPAEANTILDNIFDSFNGVEYLQTGSTQVWIGGIDRSPAIKEEGWYRATVAIDYQVYTT